MNRISDKAVNMIKQFEGCVLHSYKCTPNEQYYTIGYGHYGIKNPNVTIDEATAENFLRTDLERFEEHVNDIDEQYGYNFTQNEFDALVSFAFNIGGIQQLTQNGARSKASIAGHMTAYCTDGVNKLDGLVARREKEQYLFLHGVYPDGETLYSDRVLLSEDDTIAKLIDDICSGIYGNGDKRKELLYDTIQELVNRRYQ